MHPASSPPAPHHRGLLVLLLPSPLAGQNLPRDVAGDTCSFDILRPLAQGICTARGGSGKGCFCSRSVLLSHGILSLNTLVTPDTHPIDTETLRHALLNTTDEQCWTPACTSCQHTTPRCLRRHVLTHSELLYPGCTVTVTSKVSQEGWHYSTVV